MRRLEHLINDVRFNSNQTDTNRFSDIRLVKLFNDAQKAIQAIIFMADSGASIFDTEDTQDLVSDQESYALPSDIYAVSSINSVSIVSDNHVSSSREFYTPLRQLSVKERRRGWGYIISGSNILLSPIPMSGVTDGLKINYVKRLPTLSFRIGKVGSFISATSITMTSATTQDITAYDDYVTVVDANGVIQQSSILVTGYNTGTGVISTSTVLTDVAANDYVVLGKIATSHPQLPDETESLLTRYVERSIFAIDSSIDINESAVFTQEERDLIIALFEKKDHDVKYPPITNSTYINT